MNMSFPGMDPYLEAQLWPDFHTNFIVSLQADLGRRLRPDYQVTVEERLYVEQTTEEAERRVTPDVILSHRRSPPGCVPGHEHYSPR